MDISGFFIELIFHYSVHFLISNHINMGILRIAEVAPLHILCKLKKNYSQHENVCLI